MIWRWHISFSVRAALVFALCDLTAAPAATITGQVELTNSRDPAVHKHKDYSGVVLWLEPIERVPAAAPKNVKMLQRDKHFIPHVVAIPVGGTVDFPNLDVIYHNAFSNFSGQPFDVGLYPPNSSQSVTFKHAGIVRVFCNIHSTMSAIIAVVPTSYYVVTPESGKFVIAGVPPGDYQFHIFHERALPANLKFLERRITIPEAGLALPLISVSETGYVQAPHLDKHGKPYAPGNGAYIGGSN
jgi:plastocyanin